MCQHIPFEEECGAMRPQLCFPSACFQVMDLGTKVFQSLNLGFAPLVEHSSGAIVSSALPLSGKA